MGEIRDDLMRRFIADGRTVALLIPRHEISATEESLDRSLKLVPAAEWGAEARQGGWDGAGVPCWPGA